jgi:asparagine synthase (glutamine-hydrolysing)
MYASLEMRSPFLDRHLAEFAFTLSPQQLMSPHGNKSILKTLSERYLPHNLIYRNKQGFGVPIDDWFRKELRPAFEQLVLQGKQTLVPLNYDYIGKLLQRHADGEDHTHRLWTLYVFHCWANSVR